MRAARCLAPLPTLLLLAGSAHAATPPAKPAPTPAPAAAPPPPPDDELRLRKRPRSQQHGVAITLSGELVREPIVQGTGEINLPGQHAVAIVAGVGSYLDYGQPFWAQLVVDAGAQYRYTVKGDFDAGIYVGAEVLARIQPLQVGVPVDVPISPMVGFKYTAPFGLTADLNVGPSLVVSTSRGVQFGGMLNVQVGWAFGKAPKGG